MDIASVYSSLQTQFTPEVDEDSKRRNARPAPSASRGDTVTLSDEGKALAAAMAARREIEENGESSSFEENPGGDAAEQEADPAANAGGQSDASATDDIDAQIEKLVAQIQQTAQQMISIMSGAGAAGEKITRTAPLQERISGLEQQVHALEAQKRAEAMAAMQSS
jgi:polyphosphate kinase 2 (PPK2 family)